MRQFYFYCVVDVGFLDFLSGEVCKCLKDKYKILVDLRIKGFWNAMNELEIFYTKRILKK